MKRLATHEVKASPFYDAPSVKVAGRTWPEARGRRETGSEGRQMREREITRQKKFWPYGQEAHRRLCMRIGCKTSRSPIATQNFAGQTQQADGERSRVVVSGEICAGCTEMGNRSRKVALNAEKSAEVAVSDKEMGAD